MTIQFTPDGPTDFLSFRELFQQIDEGMADVDLSEIDPDDKENLSDPVVFRELTPPVKQAVTALEERISAYHERRDGSYLDFNMLGQAKSAITRAGGRVTPRLDADNIAIGVEITTPGGYKIKL